MMAVMVMALTLLILTSRERALRNANRYRGLGRTGDRTRMAMVAVSLPGEPGRYARNTDADRRMRVRMTVAVPISRLAGILNGNRWPSHRQVGPPSLMGIGMVRMVRDAFMVHHVAMVHG